MVELKKVNLPIDTQLDINALSCTFNKTTTSYKFLWTLALLRNLERNYPSNKIYYATMCKSMIEIAKNPIEKYKLSFGRQDKVYAYLERISKYDILIDTIENRLKAEKHIGEIGEYVMYRWLRPHLSSLAHISESKKHNEIKKLAYQSIESKKPTPYYLREENHEKVIYIHPLWKDYFQKNMGILEAWAKWHFVRYLQARNPSIPNIVNKIEEVDLRNSLRNEREFWSEIIPQMRNLRCIFSNKAIGPSNFELDHYIPWSFVGHNQLWNLVPIASSVNSQKSNKLPASIYLGKFINLQHQVLCLTAKDEKSFLRKAIAESYLIELRLDFQDLKNREKLSKAYINLVKPLLRLAAAKGFENNWKYKIS